MDQTESENSIVEKVEPVTFDTYRNISGHKLFLVVEGKEKSILAGDTLRFNTTLRESLSRFSGELMRVKND